MAELAPQAFKTKWNARFPDNQIGKIEELDLREFAQDIADSFGSVQDFTDLNLAWQNDITYNTESHAEPNPYAEYQERLYKTKQDGNTGHVPPTEPDGEGIIQDDWWIEISRAEASPIKEWEAGAYGAGLIIVYYDVPDYGELILKLDVATRPFDSTNIVTELAAEQWKILGIKTADKLGFTPATPGNWTTNPEEVAAALNELAARVSPAVADRYPDIAALIADQENQKDGAQYYVADASSDPTVDSGYAYYEYIGTTTGDLTDYRKLTEQESLDLDLSVKADKDNTITNGEMLQKKDGGNYEGSGIHSEDLKSVNAVAGVANAYSLDANSRYEKKFKTTTTISTNSTVSLTGGVEGAFINWRFQATGTIELDFSGSSQTVMFDSNDSNYNNSNGVYSCAGDTDSKFELSAHYDGSAWLVRIGGPYV